MIENEIPNEALLSHWVRVRVTNYFICLYEDHHEKYFSLNVLIVGSLSVYNYILVKSKHYRRISLNRVWE